MAVLKLPKRLVWIAALATCLAPTAPGQPVGASEVEVRAVRFASVRPPAGGAAWLETSVELRVIGRAGAPGRFVDRVGVALALAIRKRDGELDYFRSAVETVSLEPGRAIVRFYLPPEVVKREQLNTDPFARLVELTVGGRAAGTDASPVLAIPAALQSFKDRVTQSAPGNDGILVAQHDSPFADAYAGETPSVVRRSR